MFIHVVVLNVLIRFTNSCFSRYSYAMFGLCLFAGNKRHREIEFPRLLTKPWYVSGAKIQDESSFLSLTTHQSHVTHQMILVTEILWNLTEKVNPDPVFHSPSQAKIPLWRKQFSTLLWLIFAPFILSSSDRVDDASLLPAHKIS